MTTGPYEIDHDLSRALSPYPLGRRRVLNCVTCIAGMGTDFWFGEGLVFSPGTGWAFSNILGCLARKIILQAEHRGILYVYSLSIHNSRLSQGAIILVFSLAGQYLIICHLHGWALFGTKGPVCFAHHAWTSQIRS